MKTLLLGLLLTVPLAAKPSHPKWPPATYAIYYGEWNDARLEEAHRYDLVVLHPGLAFDNITPAQVARLKAGKDGLPGTADDVISIAYISIGEDEQVPAGPPRRKDMQKSGPTAYLGGAWKGQNKGYPPRYLDELAYSFDAGGKRRFGEDGKPILKPGHDGIPDENGVWGSYYTYPADPEWRREIQARMARLAGDYAVDGFFLDTVDTASPYGSYGATQKEMAGLLEFVRTNAPDKFVIANRGMFLLETHRERFLASLDGMLYESLYTVWDWARSQAVQSPWAKDEYEVLRKQVGSVLGPAFHLFLVNYVSPRQPEKVPFLHAIHDLVQGFKSTQYVSDPLLQKLYSPMPALFPAQGEPAPEPGNLSVQELGNGRFRLTFQLNGVGTRELGKDVFLDARFGTGGEPQLMAPIPIDYANLTNGIEYSGLQPGIPQKIYLRALGPAQSSRSAYLSVGLTPSAGTPPPEEVTATGLEKAVRLKWNGPKTAAYRIYQGSTPWRLSPVATATGNTHVVRGLRNGSSVWFSVARENGNLSAPISAQAQDCTPPAAPSGLRVKASGSTVAVRWSPAGDAEHYRVYFLLPGENYRIPMRTENPVLSVPDVAPGHYRVAVSSVDASGNESEWNKVVSVSID